MLLKTCQEPINRCELIMGKVVDNEIFGLVVKLILYYHSKNQTIFISL